MQFLNRISLAIFGLALLIQIGCNSISVTPELSDIKGSRTEGILILSSGCEECPTPRWVIQEVTEKNNGDKYWLDGGGSTMWNERVEFELPHSKKHADDFYPADYTGRVIIAKLPVGTYRLIECRSFFRWNGVEFVGKLGTGITLTVKPGSVTYIGQFTMLFDKSRSKDEFGLKVEDQKDRDLALAIKDKPFLSGLPVEKQIPAM